jgi:ABC-type bacteriocin/lantibiotic exporter with double-glycine peptidase domain
MQTILQIQNSSVILERIYSIIDSTDVVSEGRTDTHHEIKGSIRMSGVNFDYEGKPVLKNLNLNVKPCETLGVVGANGTGKSTIGRILVRLMDIDEGVISIDGKDIKEYSLADLRKQIMYVPSSTYIFCGTIKENILLDRIDDFDMERLKHIVELVGLKEDVENMENGYDTILYPHSVNLSSGQCQKISLARVLVKDPSVIILDEPTSALDLEIEKELTEKLKYMFKGKTIIIISHRTEILKTCDRVVMLEDGRVKDINKGVAEYADMLMAN